VRFTDISVETVDDCLWFRELRPGTPAALATPMTYVISKKCAGCVDTACVEVCPCDCIIGPVPLAELRAVPAAERGARFPGIQMFIDADECIDCGACLPECPVDAIDHERDAAADDLFRNAQFFRR
jgi:ferredoxin